MSKTGTFTSVPGGLSANVGIAGSSSPQKVTISGTFSYFDPTLTPASVVTIELGCVTGSFEVVAGTNPVAVWLAGTRGVCLRGTITALANMYSGLNGGVLRYVAQSVDSLAHKAASDTITLSVFDVVSGTVEVSQASVTCTLTSGT